MPPTGMPPTGMYGGVQTTVATLGAPVAEYRADVARPVLQGVGAFALGLIALVVDVVLLLNNFIGGLLVYIAFFGFLAMLFAIVLFNQAISSFGKRATVYQFGLSLKRGSQVDNIPWDDIAQYLEYPIQARQPTNRASKVIANTASPTVNPTLRYAIVRRNGQRIILLGYQRLKELAATVERETGARLYPQMVATYRAGQPLPFGVFTLSQAGIAQGQATIPWNMVTGERVFNGRVLIDAQGRPNALSAPLAQAPNTRVTLALIDAIRAGQV
ncbi:MAG TPA: DUF6585 family protein [Ktedonobacterales bacterium]|nr:DUF6585 family protein [Ktedonobacterales bacterium]